MVVKTMKDLFVTTLKDIYYAEKQIVKNLPKMAKKAATPELKKAFETHLQETETHVERLEKIFEELDVAPRAVRCEAMDGILAEAQEIIGEVEDDQVRDAGMLAAAQTVEHYEIARYGTLVAWAGQLGFNEARDLLEQTLAEEKKTDQLLSRLAEKAVNRQAA